MNERPRRRGWAGFVDRYGWRAYALPILTVITVAAIVQSKDAPKRPVHHDVAAKQPVHVEGMQGLDSGYQPGATPTPVQITLKSDDATSCTHNSYRQLILVSVSRQHLWACQGARQVNDTPVTTGSVAGGNQTPLGSWRVQAKQRDRYLVGPGYKDYVQYWVPFNGDFGLHDASWQTMPFGSSGWRTRGSHGCVHTPTATMAWLYRWARVGDTVVTVER